MNDQEQTLISIALTYLHNAHSELSLRDANKKAQIHLERITGELREIALPAAGTCQWTRLEFKNDHMPRGMTVYSTPCQGDSLFTQAADDCPHCGKRVEVKS